MLAPKLEHRYYIQSLVRTELTTTCQVGCTVNVVLIWSCLWKGSTQLLRIGASTQPQQNNCSPSWPVASVRSERSSSSLFLAPGSSFLPLVPPSIHDSPSHNQLKHKFDPTFCSHSPIFHSTFSVLSLLHPLCIFVLYTCISNFPSRLYPFLSPLKRSCCPQVSSCAGT